MSIKIYEAYKFPTKRLNEFILLFNQKCFEGVKTLIDKTVFKEDYLNEIRNLIFSKNSESSKLWSDKDFSAALIFAESMIANDSVYKELFDLNCSFNFWIHKSHCYFIPYIPYSIREYIQFKEDWIKFYGYWNNSDPEDGVSSKEWKKRSELWNEIALDDWDKTRLSHITLEMKMPNLNGFIPLLKYIYGDKVIYKESQKRRIYGMASSIYFRRKEDKKPIDNTSCL